MVNCALTLKNVTNTWEVDAPSRTRAWGQDGQWWK